MDFDDIFANVPKDEIDDAKKGIGKYKMKRNKIVLPIFELSKTIEVVPTFEYTFSKHLEQGYAKQLPRGFYWNMNEDQELVGFYCDATSSINDISLLMEYVVYSLHEQGEENIEIHKV